MAGSISPIKPSNDMPPPPCGKVCPDRHTGCHSKCPKWAEYQAERAEVFAAREAFALNHHSHAGWFRNESRDRHMLSYKYRNK